jgi:TPR repeat protein
MAAYYLGLLAEAGLDGPPDLAQAAQRYRQAGEAGVADADARLGALLIVEASGKAGQPAAQADGYRAAAERLQRSVDRGATSGLANLGWLYERGAGVVRDPARAVRLYDQAAHAGDTMGAYRLGLQYLNGAGGVAQNEREACRWMEQAAQAGFPHAQAELGNCFFRGIGKPRDHGRAFEWFRQAANAGLARAQEIVGALYDTGDGVAEDPARAVEWFRRSAEQGDPYGMFELGARLKMGRGVAPDERTATAWFEKAAARGETASMFSLGLNYLKGEGGLPQDDARAARWFAQAAKYKPATSDQEVTLAFARMNLATLYANGRGVNRDPEQARTLYRLAATCPNVEVARMARTYLAVMPPAAAPARDADEWSALVPPLVVGGLAVLTLDWMLHGAEGGPSASGASDTSFDWSTSYYARSLEERNNDRMMVGCFWNEASYLAYGHC